MKQPNNYVKRNTLKTYLRFFALSLLFISSFSSVSNATTDKRGVYLGAAYAISSVDTINKSNGNLYLNIPLASLPADRGGSTYDLSLFYNSKIWKATASSYLDTNNVLHTQRTLAPDQEGGWRLGLRYSWRTRTRFEDGPYPYAGQSNPCVYNDAVYSSVSEMVFPDGTSHVIHPRGDAEIDGYSNILPNGGRSCGIYNSGSKRFYTSDGSYIR